MTASVIYLVYVLANIIAQLGMMMNIVTYNWIIFNLPETSCFDLISVDSMTSESVTVDFIMSKSPF